MNYVDIEKENDEKEKNIQIDHHGRIIKYIYYVWGSFR
jgi:hypothetical protein